MNGLLFLSLTRRVSSLHNSVGDRSQGCTTTLNAVHVKPSDTLSTTNLRLFPANGHSATAPASTPLNLKPMEAIQNVGYMLYVVCYPSLHRPSWVPNASCYRACITVLHHLLAQALRTIEVATTACPSIINCPSRTHTTVGPSMT
ncbi:hypothetical protein L210DRAFT_2223580 [Boletus edulis BED1]|uniref:Uncharacterized protein n=1 Tax=Boletus edulis BED1 TaxID=1328754 RepID=A0AAD4G719_BOLED|nr:hypothetical protein L210DRAFT_2223580 [Boletus edulis BED1]